MSKVNVLYLAYIADDVYHIYKFSNYGKKKILLVAAGMAYGKDGNYTSKYKKLIDKYDLLESNKGSHYTSFNKLDFYESVLYFSYKFPVPNLAIEIIKRYNFE